MYQKADIMNCLYELGRRIKLPKDIMDAWKDYGKYNSQTQSVIVDGQRDKEKGYPNQEKDLTNIYKDLYPILTLINNLPD